VSSALTMCLGDGLLWKLSEGEGSAAEREHLEHCRLCWQRAQELADDLAIIGRALRGPVPPGPVIVPRPATRHLTWGLMAALVLIAFGALWSARNSPRGMSADGVADLADLSATIFADDAASPPVTDVDVIAAAFDSAGPCEWQAGGCEDERELLF
jgi:hypothetical protein